MSDDVEFQIEHLDAESLDGSLAALGEVIHACVQAGASVGFILPFDRKAAEAFWTTKVFPGVKAGKADLMVARIGEDIVGTVVLDHDTPANQPHRAEVRKLLVHPKWRRQGVARALMAELEVEAARRKRSLLTLDTRSGDHAEPLYTSLGYSTVGIIPGYCLDPSEERFDSTTVMYKSVAKRSSGS